MDEKKKLVSVAGLRKADPTTLQVLTQDVLRTPLVRIEPSTLTDLLALSELGEDQIPGAMVKELSLFQRQMFRELLDQPDGALRADWAAEFAALAPSQIPACLRKAILGLIEETRNAEAQRGLEALVIHYEQSEPETVTLPRVVEQTSPNGSRVTRLATPSKSKTASKSTPASAVDERRVLWIEGDVNERLSNYPSGLKEAILVAGSRHRAPWEDVSVKEVLTVLRRLRREGRVRFSAGRWYAGA